MPACVLGQVAAVSGQGRGLGGAHAQRGRAAGCSAVMPVLRKDKARKHAGTVCEGSIRGEGMHTLACVCVCVDVCRLQDEHNTPWPRKYPELEPPLQVGIQGEREGGREEGGGGSSKPCPLSNNRQKRGGSAQARAAGVAGAWLRHQGWRRRRGGGCAWPRHAMRHGTHVAATPSTSPWPYQPPRGVPYDVRPHWPTWHPLPPDAVAVPSDRTPPP